MEFTLQSAEGVPEGSVLSIKIGEIKRQGLVAKIGQPFRFASSPARPVPMKVELLSQAAPAQTIDVDPSKTSFVVDFGNKMRVQLAQQPAPELQRPPTNVKEAASLQGLPPSKLQTAQSAAAYLEHHDLVRTFQDILHGLLVLKPAEPFSYLEEHVARAKALYVKKESVFICGDRVRSLVVHAWPTPLNTGDVGTVLLPRTLSGIVWVSFDGDPAVERGLYPGSLEKIEVSGKNDKVASVNASKGFPNISGLWNISIAEDGAEFVYKFSVYDDGNVSGQARPVSSATWTTAFTGTLQGDQLSWAEFSLEGGQQLGEFSSTVNDGGQSLSGVGQPAGGGSLRFQGTKALGGPEPKKTAQRGSITSRSKVDALLETLHRTHRNLPLIMPLLPQEFADVLLSKHLSEECEKQFRMLAGDRGKLGEQDLVPVVLHLSALAPTKAQSIGEDQVRNFVRLFDADEDGLISPGEFVSLVQFVMISAHLETPEGKSLLDVAHTEEERFKEFLEIMETDRERINDIVPFLPDWLVVHLTSDEFLDACCARFDGLDVDASGVLEPAELLPVVIALTRADPSTVDNSKLMRFVTLFDVHKNGVIMRDEFIDFTQFMAVMDFLESTVEGQQVAEKMDYADVEKLKKYISLLREDWKSLPQVYSVLPRALLSDISGDAFAYQCTENFRDVDVDKKGVVEASKLFPLFTNLCAEHPIHMDDARCHEFLGYFDKEKRGTVRIEEVVELGRFVVVLAYFTSCSEWHDMSIKRSKERIEEMLGFLKLNCQKLDAILPFLPADFQEELMSYDFERHCMEDFDCLDLARTGVLEPKELIPVIIRLSQGHQLALTHDHVMEFVGLFDTKKNGVITPSEFVNFSRFMMILSYLETEEGQFVAEVAEVQTDARQVEELLIMLEKDRNAVHKVVPLLPAEVYDNITNDAFIMYCQERFASLDKDKNGTLEPEELFPVIVEISQAHPYAIDLEHCKQFTAIFDTRGDGVIRKDEFVDFVRFLYVMQYLQSEEGRKKMMDGIAIMQSSQQIDDLLEVLKRDRRDMRKVIPYLPDDLRNELLSNEFTADCLAKFKELDKDSNGSLDPLELYPIILDMTNAHHYAVDLDQCKRFTSIFDDEKTGVISQNEFVNFARFIMVISYLQTEDGRKTLAIATADERDGKQLALQSHRAAEITAAAPAEVRHMVVDLEFYQNKSEKVTRENDTLRNQMFRMEDTIRRLEDRLEEQEQRLRHAELDLRASGKQIR